MGNHVIFMTISLQKGPVHYYYLSVDLLNTLLYTYIMWSLHSIYTIKVERYGGRDKGRLDEHLSVTRRDRRGKFDRGIRTKDAMMMTMITQ